MATENYIFLNGRKIELTASQVEEIQKSFGIGNMKLSSIPEGSTFKIGNCSLIVLEHKDDGSSVVISKDLIHESEKFGGNNNYNGSNLDEACNFFAETIGAVVGRDNLVEFELDLTSDDGLDDYGTINRKAAPLTANMYRKYVCTLDKYKVKRLWWLATAYSTPTHDDDTWVKCASPSGSITGNGYCCGNGVRPFCILKSDIFVSCENENFIIIDDGE